MSGPRVAHVNLGLRQMPMPLEAVKTHEQALAIALEEEYGQFAYVADFDDDYVYVVVEGRRGVERQAYVEDDNGDVELRGEPERVRQRSSYTPAAGGRTVATSTAFEAYKQEHKRKLPGGWTS